MAVATRYCGNCGAPNPASALFCGRCGRPLAAADAGAAVMPAAVFPRATQSQITAAHAPRTHRSFLWLVAAAVVVVAAVVLGVAATLLKPSPSTCNVGCVPSSPPLLAPQRYTSSAYGYSVDYYDLSDLGLTLQQTVSSDSAIGFQVAEAPAYSWTFTGEPANGRSADQIVQSIQQSTFPGAQEAFPIPHAEVGYTEGHGEVYNLYASPGQSQHQVLFIIAAVKKNVAVELVAQGEYRSDINYGHPNPALSPAPQLFDPSLNSVTWAGDPEL